MLMRTDIGEPVERKQLKLGTLYTVPEKDGHIICMPAEAEEEKFLAILAVDGTTTLDSPPVLVNFDAIAASEFGPIKGAYVVGRHNRGELASDELNDWDFLRHGDYVEDVDQRPYIYLKQKGSVPLMLSTESGIVYPAFDVALFKHRWTIRIGSDREIAAFGGD